MSGAQAKGGNAGGGYIGGCQVVHRPRWGEVLGVLVGAGCAGGCMWSCWMFRGRMRALKGVGGGGGGWGWGVRGRCEGGSLKLKPAGEGSELQWEADSRSHMQTCTHTCTRAHMLTATQAGRQAHTHAHVLMCTRRHQVQTRMCTLAHILTEYSLITHHSLNTRFMHMHMHVHRSAPHACIVSLLIHLTSPALPPCLTLTLTHN